MTAAPPAPTARSSRLAGYLFALAAGAVWGNTGPLSTALYRAGEAITGIGFWRLVLGLAGLLLYGLLRPQLFRIDRTAWLLVGLGGGALVALFEVAYQFGIAGTGVAGAAARRPCPRCRTGRRPRTAPRARRRPGPRAARPSGRCGTTAGGTVRTREIRAARSRGARSRSR